MIIESEEFIVNPVVSVIILTYNQEKYISECLDSILSQQLECPFEVIVAEDAGSDSTRAICLEYQKKYPQIVKLLLQKENRGLIKNYIDVISLCRGKYIAHCAGDDYWIDDYKLQKQYDCLETRDGYGFVRTGGYALKKKKLIEIPGTGYDTTEGEVFNIAKYGPVGIAASIFFRRDLLVYVNFDDFINYKFSVEDYPLHAILSRHTKFAYIEDRTVVFRLLSTSISHSKNDKKYLHYVKGYIAVKKYLNEKYPNECDFNKDELDDYYTYAKIKINYRNFQYKKAKENIGKIKTCIYKNKRLALYGKSFISYYFAALLLRIIRS